MNNCDEVLSELHSLQLEMLIDIDSICRENGIQYFLAYGTLIGAVRHNGFIPWDDDVDLHFKRDDYDRFLSVAEQVLDKKKYFVQKEFSEFWPMPYSKIRRNDTTYIENNFENSHTHQGVFIDIFPIDNLSDNRFIAYLQYKLSRLLLAAGTKKRGAPDKETLVVRILNSLLPSFLVLKFCINRNNNNTSRVHCFLPSISFERNIFPRDAFSESIPHVFEGRYFNIPNGWEECLKITYGDYMKLPTKEQRYKTVHAIRIDLSETYEKYV